jgi:anaerobic selenocysteine-containing dehydrogenase
VFRLLAERMGMDHPALRETDDEMARQAMHWDHPHLRGVSFERLEQERSVRLSVPDPYAPFAQGGFPTPSGKCELYAPRLAESGMDPLAGYIPPRENVHSSPELAARYPLAFISPPAHHFLNSTFSAQPVFVRRESEASITIHPADAAARGIAEGALVRTFNDRGGFLARARSRTPPAREWWWACRSGGRSSARAAAMPMPSPARN